MKRIAIVGAGLAGSMLAILLARRGYRVDLYERRTDDGETPLAQGRSINLALSARGAHALSQIGLLDRVLLRGVPMRARAVHGSAGHIAYQDFGRHRDEHLTAIERQSLHGELLNCVRQQPNIELHFAHALTGIDFSAMSVTFTDLIRKRSLQRSYDHVVGADGANSAVRQHMKLAGIARFAEARMPVGYKELRIPEDEVGAWDRECLHLWPRKALSMIANPNPDGSLSCTLFLPHEGEASFGRLSGKREVRRLFERYFADALPRMPSLESDFFVHPTGDIRTVRGGPWHYQDKVVLIGDAAHALAPFFAQGMNSAFEDCVLFAGSLERHAHQWGAALPAFYHARRADTDAVAEMALQNFQEIQEKVACPRFLLRKRIEREIMQRYPEFYTSMHVSVMFTRHPFASVQALGRLQEALLQRICHDLVDVNDVRWQSVEPLVRQYAEEARRKLPGACAG